MRLARRAWRLAILGAALLAEGCASREFSVRTLPAETPAAENAAAIRKLQVLQAAAAAAAQRAPVALPADFGPPLTVEDVPSMATYDPWQRMNRFTYRFNARFDEAVVLPVADGYRRLPSPLRSGLHHFFSNLREVVTVINYTAQLRLAPGVRSLGRLVINSTVGIGGLFDVATEMHLTQARTGFGDTLARWGMQPGPYFVMPLLGPSTLRDGFGWATDYTTNYLINLGGLYQGTAGWVLTPLAGVDLRANISFRYYSTGSPFEYDTVRFLFVRKTLIEDEAQRLWHRPRSHNAQAPAGR